jgi:hypothetical protein
MMDLIISIETEAKVLADAAIERAERALRVWRERRV